MCVGGGGGVEGGGRIPTKKKDSLSTHTHTKTIRIRLFFVLLLYIKFQPPGSSGSLVFTQTNGGVTDRYGA